MSKKKVIAILTNFMEFNEGYSLTGIVRDQITMLRRFGHEVRLFVNEQYRELRPGGFLDVIPEKLIPFAHLKDWTSQNQMTPEHRLVKDNTAEMLERELVGIDVVFTHDFIFTGWFLPYGLGCRKASRRLPNVRWLHWIHSIPSVNRDWWRISDYGPFHKLVFPNETDRMRVAEQFQGTLNDVRVIPHIKDLRSWFDFHPDTREFINEYPAVMNADVVQIYPASTDRLEAKRVREVAVIINRLKDLQLSVCLVIANQWATGTQRKEDINHYKDLAKKEGLEVGKEFIFTSEWEPTPEAALKNWHYETGIPRHMIRELFQCSNLFVFPTREESFGLVLPEAALSGGVLCVLNKSLAMMREISGNRALYFDFGSYHALINKDSQDPDKYLRDIAVIIRGRMEQNESLKTKTFMRQQYNYDNLYNKFYAPIIGESKTW